MLRSILLILVIGLFLASAPPLSADDDPSKKLISHGDLVITRAWARATPPNAKTGAAYLIVSNIGNKDDAISNFGSSASMGVMIHSTTMKNGVMHMHHADRLSIPAGGSAILAPGGFHAMLMGLKGPLKAGTNIDITISFENSPPITLSVPVLKDAPKNHDG